MGRGKPSTGRRVVVAGRPPDHLRLPHSYADTVPHAGRAQQSDGRPAASDDPPVSLSVQQAAPPAETRQQDQLEEGHDSVAGGVRGALRCLPAAATVRPHHNPPVPAVARPPSRRGNATACHRRRQLSPGRQRYGELLYLLPRGIEFPPRSDPAVFSPIC